MNDTAATGFRRLSLDIPGGTVAGIALGAENANPDIVFMHATGFNALTYRSMLAPLGERFSVWALDARGHGRTTLPARTFGYTSWRRHSDDLIAVLEKHCSAPVTLAGHSMGGIVSLLTAGKRNDLVSGLALIDPVVLPASAYAFAQLPLGPTIMRSTQALARGAAARRDEFPSHEIALRGFNGRGVFKTFPAEVVEDYVTDGLIEDGKGGFQLACRPTYEAQTYCGATPRSMDRAAAADGSAGAIARGARVYNQRSVHASHSRDQSRCADRDGRRR